MAWLTNILRGIALLRHPETLRMLGEDRLRFLAWSQESVRHPGARLARGVLLIGETEGRLELGEGASVCHGTVLAVGDPMNGYGRISIGPRTWIGEYNNLRACGDGDITIGNDCLISQFCSLVASNHAVSRDRPIAAQGRDETKLGICVGNDVWLGAGVSILAGVSVGHGAVVGANSVVTKSVPDFEIWAGVPARRVNERR